MAYAGSDRAGGTGRMPVTIKILIAGGFGVGKTTLVGSLTEIRPLRTEEPLSEPGAGVITVSCRAVAWSAAGAAVQPVSAATISAAAAAMRECLI